MIQSIKDIFRTIAEDKHKIYFLKVSYFEIYNEQIYDLLQGQDKIHEVMTLVEDVKTENFKIRGLTEMTVTSIEEILKLLHKGEVNRHYAKTVMNHSSSRSHTMFRFTVKAVSNTYVRDFKHRESMENEQELEMSDITSMFEGKGNSKPAFATESYLNFVDLAGSEKVSTYMDNNDD